MGASRTRGGGGNKANKDHGSTTVAAAILFNVIFGCDREVQGCCCEPATAEAEKVRDEGGQWPQATASQPHKTQDDNEMGSDARGAAERRTKEEDNEQDDEVGLCMPGSFGFEDHDTGAACARTVDLFDAVSMLGNLWRRMQVR